MTIFLVPSPWHAMCVKTPVRGTPPPTDNAWPTSAAVVGRCPPAPGRVVKVGAAWFPAGNSPRVGLRQISSRRCCIGRGGVHVCFSTPTTTFNASLVRGTTGVVRNGQHEPGLVLVGAWFPAGNARVGLRLRQISSGRCCTGRGWALVSFSVSTTTFNTFVTGGMLGGVVCA